MSDQTTALNPALAAYARAMKDIGPAAADQAGAPAQSFGAMLEQTLNDAIEAGRAGEEQAMQALTGQASLQEVIEAVNAAELTLQTVVAVRDRMIAAYQDIMRMPI